MPDNDKLTMTCDFHILAGANTHLLTLTFLCIHVRNPFRFWDSDVYWLWPVVSCGLGTWTAELARAVVPILGAEKGQGVLGDLTTLPEKDWWLVVVGGKNQYSIASVFFVAVLKRYRDTKYWYFLKWYQIFWEYWKQEGTSHAPPSCDNVSWGSLH